ncbi:MAG: restriction endonuclease subunit S [Oscillospiraceae bacterium]|nr:restriction endonuclease subunit S [Oscillospiraceae bacterium]
MNTYKIKDICHLEKGKQIDTTLLNDNNPYKYINGGIKESGYYTSYNTEGEAVLVSEGGASCGYVNYINEKFWCGCHCYKLTECKFLPKYIYYALKGNQESLMDLRTGAAMPNIKKSTFLNMELKLSDDILIQEMVVNELDKIQHTIELKKQQLSSLDDLVKSRFIEMFGEINDNPNNYPIVTIDNVCHKVTDGKHGGCQKQEDSGYYYVGAREIFDGEIHYDTAPQITYTDFAKDYKRCNIEVGDLVIVNTGATIGKSAIAKSLLTDHTLLQKSVALYKVNKEIINVLFLQYCYMTHPSLYLVEGAAAQPNLLISTIKKTKIYLPPIELQNEFAEFVKLTDKSKFVYRSNLSIFYEIFLRFRHPP